MNVTPPVPTVYSATVSRLCVPPPDASSLKVPSPRNRFPSARSSPGLLLPFFDDILDATYRFTSPLPALEVVR